ncbi:hypothetical protein PLESTF_000291700 [Pleodorina starrii]|nr:hypothetical protein PLESTM_001194200 [Pleodorina starrii]GLC65423.1 hypothetical protein PLESTF_000291700 [Pleodorina starrii]
MAFTPEDSGNDARTIYAKPFSKSTTEEHVRELFGVYGSIRRVKLRREAATNSFRGSVYIEFADAAAAHAAVSSPPQQPHAAASGSGTPSRFHVMMKADYERKRANATSSAGRDGGLGGGRDGGGSGSAHKRPRHRSDGPTLSSQRIPPPPPPPPLPPPPLSGEQHAPASLPAAEPHQQAYQQQQQQQQGQHWRQVAEEREAAARALEESLRKEREDNQRLYQRLEEAQQRAQEAAAREAAANQKVLARDVEIGSLKGEIAMLRTQGAAALERQSVAHKARVTDLEASLQRLKDALLEKERGEREQRKAAGRAAVAAENGSRRSGAGPGNEGGGGGDGFLDDL